MTATPQPVIPVLDDGNTSNTLQSSDPCSGLATHSQYQKCPITQDNSTIDAESKITADAILPAEPVSSDDELRKHTIEELSEFHLHRLQEEHPIDTVETLGPVARDIATNQIEQLLHSYGDTREIDLLGRLLPKLPAHKIPGIDSDPEYADGFNDGIDEVAKMLQSERSRLAELMKAKQS